MAIGAFGRIFIADKGNERVRNIDPVTGVIKTMAGTGVPAFSGDGGPAKQAALSHPANVALDPWQNLYIVDEGNNVIRKIRRTDGVISTVAGVPNEFGYNGDGIPATQATLVLPTGFSSPGVVFDAQGHLYFADRGNQRIRKVNVYTKRISTIAGGGDIGNGGPATEAHVVVPAGLALGPNGELYIADRGNSMIRVVDPDTSIIEAYAGTGFAGYSGDGGAALDARLDLPMSVVLDQQGNVYVADQFNHAIRRIDAVTGIITTIAGIGVSGFSGDGGPASQASLNLPLAIDFDSQGNLLVADQYNGRVRRIDAQTGIITTVAGTGSLGYGGDNGPALDAALGLPSGLAVDVDDNIFIADRNNSVVRRIDAATGVITRVAGLAFEGVGGVPGYSGDGGPAKSATLRFCTGLDVDAAGNIFIADFGNGAIRRVDAQTGIIETVAGTGEPGFGGDGGPPTEALLNLPLYVLVGEGGNLYIGDVPNNRVREVIMSPEGGL